MPIAVCLIVGVYIYTLWASERHRAAQAPVEASDVMMRDILSFHKKRGGFPNDLKELEGVVWDQKQSRNYSNEKRGLTHRNYYYLYTRTTSHRFTLWGIPIGSQREEVATSFLAVTPETVRRWKGPALSAEDVKGLNADPSENELSLLGLIEQQRSANKKD